jgi:hypothetical protein
VKPIPQFKFAVALIDGEQSGWFNSSKSFEATETSQTGLPTVLTIPEYIISTIDRRHVLRRGTMCDSVYKEVCEERLPDGKFVFRVTGALSRVQTPNLTHWEFCGESGDSMEELEFSMHRGQCKPGLKTSRWAMCHEQSVSTFVGDLMIQGASRESLSEADTRAVESGLQELYGALLPGASYCEVSVISAELLSGSRLYVTYHVELDPTPLGFNAFHHSEMDALADMISEGVKSSQDTLNSLMLSFMQSSLLSSSRGASLASQSGDIGDSRDALSGAGSVYVGSGVYFESTVVQNDATPVDEVVLSRASSPSMASVVSRYDPSGALSILASTAAIVVLVGGVAFAVYRMWRSQRSESLPASQYY